MNFKIEIIGFSAMCCFALTHLLERMLLTRVWVKQPDWAESEDFHEPSWVTNSPRRVWRFTAAMVRLDKRLRSNALDLVLLILCWLVNVASVVLIVCLLVAIHGLRS